MFFVSFSITIFAERGGDVLRERDLDLDLERDRDRDLERERL